MQFLEILGENGLVGGAIYGAMLAALAGAIARAPARLRFGCTLACVAWLMAHFDSHNVVESRFMVVPLGLCCGLGDAEEPAGIPVPAAVGAMAGAV